MKPGQDRILLAIVFLIMVALVGFVTMLDDESVNLDPGGDSGLQTHSEFAGQGELDFNPLESSVQEVKELTEEEKALERKTHGFHGARGIELTVMSRATERAVPGAFAFMLTEMDAGPVDWKWRLEESVMRRGKRHRADSSGMFHVEPFIGAAYIICLHEGQYGEQYVSSYHDLRTGSSRVYMDSDKSIALQVTDEQGHGISGVPLALWRDNSEAARKSEGEEADRILIWTGITMGPEGRAFARRSLGLAPEGMTRDPVTRAIPIVAELQRGRVFATFYFPPVIPDTRREQYANPGGLAEASGQVRKLLDEVADVSLTAQGPQVRPLILPGTGSVKLRLFKDDAELYEEPCAVWIGPWMGQDARSIRGQASQDLDPDPSSISDGALPFITEAGVVLLPRVGLDTVFDITIMPLNGLHDPVQIAVVGPTRVKEIKVVDVPMGPERARLDFSVQDDEGKVLAEHWVDIELGVAGSTRLSPEAIKRQRLKTDVEGKISFRVPVEFSRYPQMELRVTGMKSPSSRIAPFCARLLKSPPPAGYVDAGVIQLAGSHLVCKGRIVDPKGQGVGAAEIQILRRPFDDEAERSASDERVVAWTKSAAVERVMAKIETSSRGYFVHGGYLPSGSWKIVVKKNIEGVDYMVETDFEPGADNLELVLRPVIE